MELHHVQRPATPVPRIITPGGLDEALAAVARPGFKPVAGGTDLLVELDRTDHAGLAGLVDLTRVAGLDTIETRDGRIHIGPLVTHSRCVESDLLRRHAPALVQACHEIGSPQLRNRATVAGNIVTASPANDTLTPLLMHDAVLTLRSVGGSRMVRLAEFHLGVRRTVLEADELVTGIDIDPLPGHRSIYLKLGLRRAQAISVVHLALAVALGDESESGGEAGADAAGEAVRSARLTLGSVAPTAVRVEEVERHLAGRVLTDEVIAEAGSLAAEAVNPIDDLRATADYRSDLVAEMVGRALRAVAAGSGVVPERPPMLWGGTDGRAATGPEHSTEHGPDDPVTCTLNGAVTSARFGGRNLLDWVRGTGATGTKEGCAEGECGSCTVHLDGMAVLSCLIPATRAEGAAVTTIEGLADADGLDPLQEAFVEAGGVQCGFCIPGFLMSGVHLAAELRAHGEAESGSESGSESGLGQEPDDGDAQARLKAGLSGNLCRCTGYYKIEQAVTRVVLGR